MLFGITPPRRSASPDKVREIASVTLQRLAPLDLDGLILYDIDDESDRNPGERPFPYLPTMDPASFYDGHLGEWDRPVVIYRCVGKYDEDELRTWLADLDLSRVLGVFVGASSGSKAVRTDLRRAQKLHSEVRPEMPLGAVVIPERHARSGDEHLRMVAKQERGCTFFISQVIYDVAQTRALLASYVTECRERGVPIRPVIFTLSLCGSPKTLEFLQWLGVEVPSRVSGMLRHSDDPLADSYRECVSIARELISCCGELGVPFGFHVESVSIRKAEIEAATDLAAEVSGMLRGRSAQ
jgi:Methylenetetrahydrofolate reductase